MLDGCQEAMRREKKERYMKKLMMNTFSLCLKADKVHHLVEEK